MHGAGGGKERPKGGGHLVSCSQHQSAQRRTLVELRPDLRQLGIHTGTHPGHWHRPQGRSGAVRLRLATHIARGPDALLKQPAVVIESRRVEQAVGALEAHPEPNPLPWLDLGRAVPTQSQALEAWSRAVEPVNIQGGPLHFKLEPGHGSRATLLFAHQVRHNTLHPQVMAFQFTGKLSCQPVSARSDSEAEATEGGQCQSPTPILERVDRKRTTPFGCAADRQQCRKHHGEGAWTGQCGQPGGHHHTQAKTEEPMRHCSVVPDGTLLFDRKRLGRVPGGARNHRATTCVMAGSWIPASMPGHA